MENFRLVHPENLNHYGFLFGGYLLQWVDEVAWIAAARDYPGCNFVTIAMDRVEFRQSIRKGSILRFDTTRVRVGNTSVDYRVEVAREGMEQGSAFGTTVTLVRVDESGQKKRLPQPADDSPTT